MKTKDVPGAGASAIFASAAYTENDWIKITIFDDRVETKKIYLSFLGRLTNRSGKKDDVKRDV